jgi:glycosyltransferase involved in cell wall biosynthesis
MDVLAGPDSISSKASRRRSRLAVVSTYDDLCGIAAFTRSLVRTIEGDFDLEVFDLDQFLLRQREGNARRKADAYFRDICLRLREFDFVNLQLEFGTLGATMHDSLRRLRWLCEAAPALCVTFHTVPRQQSIDWWRFWESIRSMQPVAAMDQVGQSLWWRRTAKSIFSILRRTAASKPLRLIVHTSRDRRYLHHVGGFEHVFDHPLSFLRPVDIARVVPKAGRHAFPGLAHLPDNAKLVGAFGFLSRYKGFETAIRALRYLPSDHHLLIFGGVHPNESVIDRPMAPYIGRLIDEIGNERGPSARIREPSTLDLTPEASMAQAIAEDRLSERVHFMGVLPDEQFWVAMASCDAVVLPYLEVGQSSSGAASQAIELGCRTLVSRTQAFLQLGEYFPGHLEFFDIGNHLELANRLRSPAPTKPYAPLRNTATLRQVYLAAHATNLEARPVGEGTAMPAAMRP